MGLSCRFSLKPIHWRNLQHSILKTIGPQMVKLLLSLARRHALLKEEVAVGRSWVCWLDRCWMPFMVMFDHFCWLAEYIYLHRHLHVYILYTSNYMYTYVYIYTQYYIYIHTYTLSIYTYIYIHTYIIHIYIYRVYAGVFSWSWQRRKIISPLVGGGWSFTLGSLEPQISLIFPWEKCGNGWDHGRIHRCFMVNGI